MRSASIPFPAPLALPRPGLAVTKREAWQEKAAIFREAGTLDEKIKTKMCRIRFARRRLP